MKKAFTLIELMISIVLLSLITSFLYQSIAQLQSSNQSLLHKTKKVDKREEVLKLLYNDFINAYSLQRKDTQKDSDMIIIQSSNSLHDMSRPYVSYKIYRDNETLRRVEHPTEKIDAIDAVFRFNDIVDEVELFKVYEQKGHYLIYLKAKSIDDIYLDIIPPALRMDNNKTNTTN